LLHLILESHHWMGLCADSEEKHVLASDVDAVEVESLKALDPNRPIREADIRFDQACPPLRQERRCKRCTMKFLLASTANASKNPPRLGSVGLTILVMRFPSVESARAAIDLVLACRAANGQTLGLWT